MFASYLNRHSATEKRRTDNLFASDASTANHQECGRTAFQCRSPGLPPPLCCCILGYRLPFRPRRPAPRYPDLPDELLALWLLPFSLSLCHIGSPAASWLPVQSSITRKG